MTAPLLAATGLAKRFGGITAVAGADLSLGAREIVCVIGPNGAGKSTFLNLLCGAIRPDRGSILFDGRDLTGTPVHGFARAGILRKFQVPSIFPTMTVRANLLGAADAVNRSDADGEIDAILHRLSLQEWADTPAGRLPHGGKQLLEIGLCLMSRAKLLLLDEPTAGLTTDETRSTARLVQELAREAAVIVIEHDMAFVRDLACRTCVMHQGTVVRDAPFAEIEQDSFVRDIYLGRR